MMLKLWQPHGDDQVLPHGASEHNANMFQLTAAWSRPAGVTQHLSAADLGVGLHHVQAL